MKHIVIIGAGTMGHGIALVFARFGFPVTLIDLSEKQLSIALSQISKNLNRLVEKQKISSDEKVQALVQIQTSTTLQGAVDDADLIIEAVPEDEALKIKLFKDLNKYAPRRAIIASNTSAISITKLASVVSDSSRVIGMHFMNPVPLMRLVEVIRGYHTSSIVTHTILELCRAIEKTPIQVNDYPGFVSNRILMPMINEAISALHEGVAEVEAIDAVMMLGMAHPMGPLQLADFIGLDVCLSILDVLYDGFGNPKYAPSPLLVNMVHAGRLGKKTGEGFYRYAAGKDPVVSSMFR